MIGLSIAALLLGLVSAQFNNPPGVDIWCGKAYRASNASFNPGGQFLEPARSKAPLLNLKATPRMSMYLEDEESGSLLVNASISEFAGVPWHAVPVYSNEMGMLDVEVLLENGLRLTNGSTTIGIGGGIAEIPISFSNLPARLEPYNLAITAISHQNNGAIFQTSTQLSRLPLPKDNTTAARIDNKYGSLSYRRASSNPTAWQSIFPHTYYVQWSLYWNSTPSTLNSFSSLGYNMIHIVPTGSLGDSPFPWDEFQPYLDRAAELGLLLQYDVLWNPENLTEMISQVERLRSHPSILLWYTGDEPDGKSNPVNSTRIAYERIKSMDPYHPVSLALNCKDFWYEDYASGAEIILSDVYPISTNTSHSTVYDTPCNATYGCCGCDDCTGSFSDISDRLDEFHRFDETLGWQKTHWGAPQAFGNETFWSRYPTAAEEVVMDMLSVNHGAKGIVMWDFPTTEEILGVTNKLAGVLTDEHVMKFLVEEPLTSKLGVEGGERVDAAVWVAEKEVLVSVVNLSYGDLSGTISVRLPEGVRVTETPKSLWGGAEWTGGGESVVTNRLLGLEVSLLVLERL